MASNMRSTMFGCLVALRTLCPFFVTIALVVALSACAVSSDRTSDNVPSLGEPASDGVPPAVAAANRTSALSTSPPAPAVHYNRWYCESDGGSLTRGMTEQPASSELRNAAEHGDSEKIRYLLASGSDVQDSDSICRVSTETVVCRPTPLQLAVRSGNIDAVRLLLDAGADVNDRISSVRERIASHPWGALCLDQASTPLSSAADDHVLKAGPRYLMGEGIRWSLQERMKLQTELIALLLNAGADTSIEPKTVAMQPISAVARMGNVDAISILAEHGADVNSRNAFGWTPLRWAIHWSRIRAIETLLELGARLDTKDPLG